MQSSLPMIGEYSDKALQPDPLSHWEELCREGGARGESQKGHDNLQTSIGGAMLRIVFTPPIRPGHS